MCNAIDNYKNQSSHKHRQYTQYLPPCCVQMAKIRMDETIRQILVTSLSVVAAAALSRLSHQPRCIITTYNQVSSLIKAGDRTHLRAGQRSFRGLWQQVDVCLKCAKILWGKGSKSVARVKIRNRGTLVTRRYNMRRGHIIVRLKADG